MKHMFSIIMSIVLFFSFMSVASCKQQPVEESVKQVVTPELTKDDTAFLDKLNKSLAAISETVKPSVVNISTTKTVSIKKSPFGDFFDDPFFRKFFGDQFHQFGGKKEFKTSALGSGVIITEDGYILTNSHVVQNVDEIKIILYDKREFTGKLVGTDPQTDLAIVKVEARGLPAIKMGDSTKLKVGELVIAIGNPFGLGNTITMGIVSAVKRSRVGIAEYENFIQTDAAINPGNSGGALVNIHAELVGINTAIFSTTGGNVGIGFAIPSSLARSVMDSIIKYGKVVRGWLGVSIQDLTPELAKHFDIEVGRGALVTDVVKDSPAEKSGFQRGDLIVKFEGRPVEDATTLKNMVGGKMPGTNVKINIIRNGKEKTLSVKLGELTGKMITERNAYEYENAMQGVHIQDLTPEIREKLEIPEKVTGVIVTNIEEDSPAYGMLKKRDVIHEVNRKVIKSVNDYDKAISGIGKEDDVLLLIYRAGGYIYVTISP